MLMNMDSQAFLPDAAGHALTEPADFDDFWNDTLAEAQLLPQTIEATPVESPFAMIELTDLTFSGFGGTPVSAWLVQPAGANGPFPAVVQFTPYGSGRGLPCEDLHWASAGYAHVIVDTRGQGVDGAARGDTGDPYGSGPSVRGWMTRGIESPHEYFYRRVFVDAVLAVEAVATLPSIDPARITVTGRSQGGGISLAAAALSDAVCAVMPDVPLMQSFRHAVELGLRDPYAEIQRYLAKRPEAELSVFRTLSYFDGVSFAARATVPALFSVASRDETCPPATVVAAYEAYGSRRNGQVSKRLESYRYNGHEGGGFGHLLKQIDWLGVQA